MNCPNCFSEEIVKNGSLNNVKPRYKCKSCGRQLVLKPKKSRISDETKALIDKLLLERLPLAGMVRVVGVSKRWLPYYVNNKYDNIPKTITVKKKAKGRLIIEGDELWSFVKLKAYQQWIWLATDRQTKE